MDFSSENMVLACQIGSVLSGVGAIMVYYKSENLNKEQDRLEKRTLDNTGPKYRNLRKQLQKQINHNKRRHKFLQITYASSAISTVLFGYGIWSFQEEIDNEQKAIEATTGKLEVYEPQPPIDFNVYGDGKINSHITRFGPDGGAVAGTYAFDLFNKGWGTDLKIERKEGKVSASVTLRGKDGKLIARLTDNEWSINRNNYYDRNYTKNRLEIVDMYGDVVLQIILYENLTVLQAKLYGPDGKALGYANGEIHFESDGDPLEFTIERMFRYPSSLHLGELI